MDTVSLSDSAEDNDWGAKFVEGDWIGVGKIYDDEKLPLVVRSAKRAALSIPETYLIKSHLPSTALGVADFIKRELPYVSSELISTKTAAWFSMDPPSINLDNFFSRSVPSAFFVGELERVFGQAWLDGAKSVVDVQFNDGRDRLPLWIIAFWRQVVDMVEMQKTWRHASRWLEHEAKRGYGEPTLKAIQKSQILLNDLGWNVVMPYGRNTTTTLQLSRFLGSRFLSDDHITMMVEELARGEEMLPNGIKLASITFSVEIERVEMKLGLPQSAYSKTLLCQFKDQATQGKLRKLYYPLHVNGNHWVAGEIDFTSTTISFGKSTS